MGKCPILLLTVLACLSDAAFAGGLEAVTGFGPNPGNLGMYRYVPAQVPDKAPLVLVLHGCTQTAASYAQETGFNELAERQGFLVAYAEQKKENHRLRCFHWFSRDHFTRDRGEAASLRQMVDRMQSDHSIDPAKVFVTGTSAGACMSVNMLAAYPEVFAGGAIMAGIPHGCADGIWSGLRCMFFPKDLSPEEWGRLARAAAPAASPSYPTVSIFQGSRDRLVDPRNAEELVEQWTAVHATDSSPDSEERVQGHSRRVFLDTAGKPVVELYILDRMGHGIAVDPGTRHNQGGQVGRYAFDVGLWSSYYAAKFWGIVREEAGESGPQD